MLRNYFLRTMNPLRPTLIRTFNFSTSQQGSTQTLLKICQLLKIKHSPINDEIGSGIQIRLIEGETGTFLGIKRIEEAMFFKEKLCKN